MTVLLVLLLLLNINSIAPASLHGEEKEHDIFAEIDISLSLLVSPCDNIKCEQGGTCVNGQCVCPAKTAGMYCEENHCEPNPCYANGKCNQTEEGYVCECSANFLGPNCNVIQSPNYPDNYNPDTRMTRNIPGIPDKYILLQFEEVFEIELNLTPEVCVVPNYLTSDYCYDYIQIVTGSDDVNW